MITIFDGFSINLSSFSFLQWNKKTAKNQRKLKIENGSFRSLTD
jgi:hypothetical protein